MLEIWMSYELWLCKIKEQIVSISALVTAIGALLSIFKPIADFVLTLLFK